MMKKTIIFLIRSYQRSVSPDQGFFRFFYVNKYQHCLMYPSCSEYMVISVDKYGSVRGVWKGILRIFRCHPYQKEYIDIP
jgi:putative component of membrane protein insertase Oxa1/YidC/SpoIIIJ protein YidD